MLIALLITILPTLLMLILLPKLGLKIRSNYFAIAFAWFSGMYLFTIGTFLLALVYSTFFHVVLMKATYTTLIIVQIILFFFAKDFGNLLLSFRHLFRRNPSKYWSHSIIVTFCLLFALAFFMPQLALHNNHIYRSPIYWDFHWHAALVQNFVYGDNFPPQNEAFSGVPETYHFFWGVVAAIYEISGLNVVDAINTISIITFFFLLITVIGLCEELFHSKYVGVIAVILILTSSSLHALYSFTTLPSHQDIFVTIRNIFTNTSNPFWSSLLHVNQPYYEGPMFNLFYFLEERQLIFGTVYLLLCTWIITKREQMSRSLLFGLGIGMGAFFLWHLYVAIMVLCALFVVLIFGKQRQKTMWLCNGFIIIFGAHYFYFKKIMQTYWFNQTLVSFPQLNFTFTSRLNYPFSFKGFFDYFSFAYGIKPFFLLASCLYLWRKQKNTFLTLTAIIFPTFLLINTIQLSPAAISENHKWLRPMNIIIDVLTAFIIYKVFFTKKNLLLWIIGIVSMFFLTISGIIELMPFLNSRPIINYSAYPSSITSALWQQTSPQATFIGYDTTDIQLAGRKLFLGETLGGNMQLKMEQRKQIVLALYATQSKNTFCYLTKANGIDYIEFPESQLPTSLKSVDTLAEVTALDDKKLSILFVDTKKVCKIH